MGPNIPHQESEENSIRSEEWGAIRKVGGLLQKIDFTSLQF